MSDVEDRLDRLESLVEQQQETIERQQQQIDAQQETIERQQVMLAEQGETNAQADRPSDGPQVSRRGAMKTAGLVGLLGAGAGAATAGPTIGEPGNQVETLYAQGLAGDLTGGTTVTDLVGGGLTVDNGSLEPALSSDLTLSNGDLAVDVGPSEVGAAPDSHGNEAHSSEFATSGEVPTSPGDIGAAADSHGNEAHSTNFAASSDVPTSPGDIGAASDNHGNEAHSSQFATSGEVPTSPGDIGAASTSHGNGAHSTTFVSSLSGGAGIAQGSIGQGDTVSVAWGDASGLDSSGQPVDFSAANDLNSGGSITDFSGANDLDGNGNIADFSGANDLDGSGNLANFGDANNLDSSGNVQWGNANGLQSNGSVDESQLSVGAPPNLVQSSTSNAGSNSASGDGASTVAGGIDNSVQGGSSFDGGSFIGAGSGNQIDGGAGFIGSGRDNVLGGLAGETICGGSNNEIPNTNCFRAFIGAGGGNRIDTEGFSGENARESAIVAGDDNFVDATSDNAIQAFIGAGRNNTIQGNWAFIGAGENNTVSGDEGSVITADGEEKRALGAVVGGYDNRVASSFGAVLNGSNNEALGTYATVPGGADNTARGAFSLAFGNNATVEADGAVAFADASDAEFTPEGEGLHAQMTAHVPEVKREFDGTRVDTDDLDAETALERMADIEVGTNGDGDGLRIDPETFNEAFDLDGEGLGTLDVDAALVAAVQALVERLDER